MALPAHETLVGPQMLRPARAYILDGLPVSKTSTHSLFHDMFMRLFFANRITKIREIRGSYHIAAVVGKISRKIDGQI